jgi:hypothetical protein
MGHDQLIVLWKRVEAAICISIVFQCQYISEPEVRSRFYGRSNFKFNPVSGCSAGILASRDEVQFGVIFIRVIVASVLLSRTLAEMVPFGHCIRILIQCSTQKDTLTSSTIMVSEIRIRAVAGAFQHSHVSTQAMHAVLNSNRFASTIVTDAIFASNISTVGAYLSIRQIGGCRPCNTSCGAWCWRYL